MDSTFTLVPRVLLVPEWFSGYMTHGGSSTSRTTQEDEERRSIMEA
jgi:hypothetical protein